MLSRSMIGDEDLLREAIQIKETRQKEEEEAERLRKI